MNRRQKREAKVHALPKLNPPGVRYPANVRVIPDDQSQHEYICEGCDRVSEEKTCLVYAFVPPYYLRHNCCPFNKKNTTLPKVKVRVGQQKGTRIPR
jgi:hypothetical protein